MKDLSKTATTTLLVCGAVAGPVFISVTVLEAFTRAGFDITRHPPSLLSLGDLGWIQIVNFIVGGVLFILGAVGIRLASPARYVPALVATFGVSMVIGGLFTVDGGLGFPAGAATGRPATMSWHAMVHLAALAIGFASLVAACAVYSRHNWRAGQRRWSVYSAAAGLLTAACFVIVNGGLTRGNLLPLWLAVVIGWSWASGISARLLGRVGYRSERNYVFSGVPGRD